VRGANPDVDLSQFDVGWHRRAGRHLRLDLRRGGRPRPASGAGPEAGQTVETTLEIPFRTAALGGKVPVEMDADEECTTCGGSGAAQGATLKTCPECNGRGAISFGQGGFAVQRPCPMCLGRGQIPTLPCPTCKGAATCAAARRCT
jgi:molecular chaperone DnaJ